MYKSFTAEQYKKKLGFNEDYLVAGVLVYGTLYEERVISLLKKCLEEMGIETELLVLPHPFLRFARQFSVNNKTYWFSIAYGGTWISEYLHWACMFGSRKNILIGSCGGLKRGIQTGDFIVPKSSFADESSAKMYNRNNSVHKSDLKLSESLSQRIASQGSVVWDGELITCQAMIGETTEDIQLWSRDGYSGVEMESSTVFAVSEHFGVPAAASMYVADNLIENHSNMDDEFELQEEMREQRRYIQMKAAISELLSES